MSNLAACLVLALKEGIHLLKVGGVDWSIGILYLFVKSKLVCCIYSQSVFFCPIGELLDDDGTIICVGIHLAFPTLYFAQHIVPEERESSFIFLPRVC